MLAEISKLVGKSGRGAMASGRARAKGKEVGSPGSYRQMSQSGKVNRRADKGRYELKLMSKVTKLAKLREGESRRRLVPLSLDRV